ncbi:MAG TPA: GxxExxY protein [Lentisphaeria bacterium]|nr:MAG: GxxExxY protein [Lentisphaerae bacterium GWF2_50_93]HCE44857.1 GxxExxY protein [Lentisphaeria bacterium]
MNENEIAKLILDAAFEVHRRLGPGLFESVYESILSYELNKKGLKVQRQVPIKLSYDDLIFDEGFKADIIVEEKVIIELKSVEDLHPVHKKQLLTYLRVSGMKLGLLINFNESLLKNGLVRIVNGLEG